MIGLALLLLLALALGGWLLRPKLETRGDCSGVFTGDITGSQINLDCGNKEKP